MNKNTNPVSYKLLVISSLILVAGGSHAEIYKCVNTNAEVYYNDKPCPVTNIERKIKAVKDPVGGYIPPAFVADKETGSSVGVVVGSVTGRKTEETEKEGSDSSTQRGNSKGSNSAGNSQSQSSDSRTSSSEPSSSTLKSDSGNSSVKNSISKANKQKHLSKLIEIEPSS